MQHLDLFSGIGGFALAAKWAGIETIAFCEIDEFAKKILHKNFPNILIHEDIKFLNGKGFKGIDLITGGYPCQPFSTAGKRRGKEDNRHLWPEMLKIIKSAKPSWVVCENVIGHITLGFKEVCSDLESQGYAVQSFVIPACAKDAPHRRDRIWIIANANSISNNRFWDDIKEKRTVDSDRQSSFRVVFDPRETTYPRRWGRANGIPSRMDKDRLKALGNAIVPQVAYEILSAIKTLHNN